MRFITWNCRGLGRPRAVRALLDLCRSQKPKLLGLIETKLLAKDWGFLRVKLGFRNCFVVDRKGLSGGLALLWHDDTDLSIISYSRYHIDAVIEDGVKYRCTLFYGNPRADLRKHSWELLRMLKGRDKLPWIVMGDFNEIIQQSEMRSRRKRDRGQMMRFKDALWECELKDIELANQQFTYSNRRKGVEETKCRIDRAVANKEWFSKWPNTVLQCCFANTSDHKPIMLCFDRECWKNATGTNLFRFEPMWLREREFKEYVTDKWLLDTQVEPTLVDKFSRCAGQMQEWNKNKFGNVHGRIKNIKWQIEQLSNLDRTEEVIAKENCLSAELDEWLAREELLWKQRSRMDWLKAGDKNTTFFKMKASQRRSRKIIKYIKNEQGTIVTEPEEIIVEFSNFYKKLFQGQDIQHEINWDVELQDIEMCVSAEVNDRLKEPYTNAEIKRALFEMHPAKAPGIDGYSTLFYQKFWSVIQSEVCHEILQFLNTGDLDKKWNETVIIMVPKGSDPQGIADYRPISLCNVFMRIVTKVLANRIKDFLPSIIGEEQSAFIKGRLISDNILLAHEVMHSLKQKRKRKDAFLAVKIDMSKAYDRVNWRFLEKFMKRIGLESQWVDRVMHCVESVSYKLKINDKISEVIHPARGIRQGDPISPYLFILCQEWLSLKLRKMQREELIQGIQIARQAPRLNHLLFADDCLIFIKAELRQLDNLGKLLSLYEKLAGQKVNYSKSELIGSSNMDRNMISVCGNFLGMKIVEGIPKYLGLPLNVDRSKTKMFHWLEEKIQGKFKEWNTSLLSCAGKETLIKACIQAYPIYAMTCFRLPSSLCDKWCANALRFWWANGVKDKGIHWVNRDVLLKDKLQGGMGFRSLDSFNVALLMKQLWRISKNPTLLISQMLKAKYFDRHSIIESKQKVNDSFAWKSICNVLDIFKNGIDGDRQNPMTWCWKYGSSGMFSVKEGYRFAYEWKMAVASNHGSYSDTDQTRNQWKKLWKIKAPDRVKIHIWKLFHHALPVHKTLVKRGMHCDVSCCFCGYKHETLEHLFIHCWWSKVFWNRLQLGEVPHEYQNDVTDWIWFYMNIDSAALLRTLAVGVWVLWRNRNMFLHEKKGWSIDESVLKVKSYEEMFEKGNILGNGSVLELDDTMISDWIIFCDGSWCKNTQTGGFAAVALLNNLIYACKVGFVSNCDSLVEIETRGVIAGIELAAELKCQDVYIVSDNIDTVWGFSSGFCGEPKVYRCITDEVFTLCRKHNVSFKHVPRELNSIADGLSKLGRRRCLQWNRMDALPMEMQLLRNP